MHDTVVKYYLKTKNTQNNKIKWGSKSNKELKKWNPDYNSTKTH